VRDGNAFPALWNAHGTLYCLQACCLPAARYGMLALFGAGGFGCISSDMCFDMRIAWLYTASTFRGTFFNAPSWDVFQTVSCALPIAWLYRRVRRGPCVLAYWDGRLYDIAGSRGVDNCFGLFCGTCKRDAYHFALDSL